MKVVECDATVTPDGQITLPAPPGLAQGKHRVRIEIIDAEPSDLPKPKRWFKGRPVYDEEDMKKMKPHLPPETDWMKELNAE